MKPTMSLPHLCKLDTLEVTAFPPPSLIPVMTACILLTAGANKTAQLVDSEELIEAIIIIQVTL
jgi:nitrogenase molybdenum-iron protein alpha/beta subunit